MQYHFSTIEIIKISNFHIKITKVKTWIAKQLARIPNIASIRSSIDSVKSLHLKFQLLTIYPFIKYKMHLIHNTLRIIIKFMFQILVSIIPWLYISKGKMCEIFSEIKVQTNI